MHHRLAKIFGLFLLLQMFSAGAEELYKVEFDDDEILLVDVVLNNQTVAFSIDTVFVNDQLLVAIEPLLDALKVRYQLSETELSIWNKQQQSTFQLLTQANTNVSGLWASDGFLVFVELDLFKRLFGVEVEFESRRLQLVMRSPNRAPIFPAQIIEEQEKQRALDRVVSSGKQSNKRPEVPITLQDQYRLATVPHGRFTVAGEKTNENSGFNTSVQVTSDLLYHSAELTLVDTEQSALSARLSLSRYKTSPDDYILNLYDQYQFGDISSRTNSLNTGTNAGIGVIFERRPDNYRDDNQAITLRETAPPGWEAELFHNQVFLAATTVPDDGQLIFEDVEVTYGNNVYTIKLYGPFGEREVISKNVDLTQNALKGGEFAHAVYALDRNHRLINDQNDVPYEFTDFGATFDYGVSDIWQIGTSFSNLANDRQLVSVNNAFSLPGMLLENDLAVDQDGNYAQITTLKGGAFDRDRYSIEFESGRNFDNDRVQLVGDSYRLRSTYYMPTEWLNLNFSLSMLDNDSFRDYRFSNRLSANVGNIRFRHELLYYNNTFKLDETRTDGLQGSLGISGNLPLNIRVSANIDYDPQADDPIKESSSLLLQTRINDPWEGSHYFTFNYLPLVEDTNPQWRFTHRVAWYADEFQLNLTNSYDENDDWSIQLGLQFFLGYDYRNNRLVLSERLQPNTASLDVHTYLDRQINGVPDPLDYDLSGVRFNGNPEWQEIESGKDGRTVLPGVYADTPFSFSANWKEGSNTVNNDYVVFTHPGAYIKVNMPFVLSTELIGYVLRTNNNQEVGIQNAVIELYTDSEKLIASQETDRDGYFEFLGLNPGKYQVVVAQSTLQEKGYTASVIGFTVLTGGNGGYVELPALTLRRLGSGGERDAEQILQFNLDKDRSEPIVWDNDENVRKNFFTLPTKNPVAAQYTLEQASSTAQQSVGAQGASAQSEVDKPQQIPSANNPSKTLLQPSAANGNVLPSISVSFAEKPVVDEVESKPVTAPPSAAQGKTAPAPQPSTIQSPQANSNYYVIQLGLFSERQAADNLRMKLAFGQMQNELFALDTDSNSGATRLIYGKFLTKIAGLEFANKYLPKGQAFFVRPMQSEMPVTATSPAVKAEQVVETAVDGQWVIQLHASESPIVKGRLTRTNAALGPFYVGQKVNANGVTLYCLLSQPFASKELAKQAIERTGLKGWVTTVDQFTDLNKFN
jgi:cell division protein FtsN